MTAQPSNRVLIVEDDAGMRGLIARHFRRRGYEVEQAEAAEEVVGRFGASGGRYDVVVTDVNLPGTSGVDLARQIRHLRPEQPVVVITGDTDASIAQQALRNGASGFLLKPFEFFELDAVVEHAIRRTAEVPLRPQVVARVGTRPAHITLPARVVLAPARPPRPVNVGLRLRVAVVAAALLAVAWLAGSALVP